MSQSIFLKRFNAFYALCTLCVLCAILTTNTALAQGGPAPEVRRAVSALMEVVNSTDDAALHAFVSKAADPSWVAAVGEAEVVSRLQAIRAATRDLGNDVSVEGAPDGVRVILTGASVRKTIALGFSPDGVNKIEFLADDAGASPAARRPGQDGAVHAHVAALERSGHKPLDEVVSAFEREHFSENYMAETTRDERRTILDRIRAVAANAGGVMLDESDGEVKLKLRGPESLTVVFKVEPQEPFGIDALRTEAIDSDGPAMQLGWKDAEKTFRKLEKEGFSGVVHLAKGDKTFLHKAYGKSNRELGFDTQIDTIFGIGSTPIDFTVTGIFMLAQAGKLSLDDTLDTFFDTVPADKSGMTIQHLISGQSGLPDFHGIPGEDWDLDLAWIDRETAMARIFSQPLLFAPGSSRAHSHSAYGVAAAIIEIVSGKDYFTFMDEKIFKPAAMTRTGMYGQARDFKIRDFAVGYANSSIGVPNIPPNWGLTSWLVMGSGGMYSTLGDMLRFYEFVRSGKALEDQYAERYRGESIGVGGSDRGFYFFHANRGAEKEAMMLVNGEGRSPEMRALSRAMENLVMEND